jgi:hypothetical protein
MAPGPWGLRIVINSARRRGHRYGTRHKGATSAQKSRIPMVAAPQFRPDHSCIARDGRKPGQTPSRRSCPSAWCMGARVVNSGSLESCSNDHGGQPRGLIVGESPQSLELQVTALQSANRHSARPPARRRDGYSGLVQKDTHDHRCGVLPSSILRRPC